MAVLQAGKLKGASSAHVDESFMRCSTLDIWPE